MLAVAIVLGAEVAAAQVSCSEGRVAFSELVVRPSDAELVELHNAGTEPAEVGRACISDDSGSALVACFPAGTVLAPGAHLTVALGGSAAFERIYGFAPTYELYEDGVTADGVPDLQHTRGRIGRGEDLPLEGGLKLICWDGVSASPARIRWGSGADGVLPIAALAHSEGVSWQRTELQAPPEEAEADNLVQLGTWTTATPTPGAPYLVDLVNVRLQVAPSESVSETGEVSYVLRVRAGRGGASGVTVVLSLPDSLEIEGGMVGSDAPVFQGDLDPNEAKLWVVDARFDPEQPPTSLVATATATWSDQRTEQSAAYDPPAPERAPVAGATPSAPRVEFQSQGRLGTFGRAFAPDGDPATTEVNAGLDGRLGAELSHGAFDERAELYILVDHFDPERTALLAQEALLQWRSKHVRVLVGAVTLNVSRLDSFHPADVINARFLDTEIENPTKIGEPMVAVRMGVLRGAAHVWLMPLYTAPRLPSTASRLGGPDVALGPPLWLERSGAVTRDRLGVQWAVNLEQTLGPADFAVHLIQHQDRSQPLLVQPPREEAPAILLQPVTQLGGTYNHAVGATVLKGEWAWRRFATPDDAPAYVGALPDRDHVTVAGGLEYTFGLGPLTAGAFLETQAVVLEGPDDAVLRQSLSPFQRDVLVGTRLAFNDRSDRALVLAGIFDLETRDEAFLAVRYNQRIGERLTLAAGLRGVVASAPGPSEPADGLKAIRDAQFATVQLDRHF